MGQPKRSSDSGAATFMGQKRQRRSYSSGCAYSIDGRSSTDCGTGNGSGGLHSTATASASSSGSDPSQSNQQGSAMFSQGSDRRHWLGPGVAAVRLVKTAVEQKIALVQIKMNNSSSGHELIEDERRLAKLRDHLLGLQMVALMLEICIQKKSLNVFIDTLATCFEAYLGVEENT